MPDVGPFSVTPQQVSGLSGSAFVVVVSQLLAAELAASESTEAVLDVTYRDNIADGGVDARTRRALATRHIPEGDTAWQFKAGDFSPAACALELEDATEALEILRGGGKYRLVLGASLTPQKISKRRARIEEKARELGLAVEDDTFEVVAGDALANWLEAFPSLAVSPIVRGPGVVGQSFEDWARSARHATTWVSSAARDEQLESVRAFLANNAESDLHLEGVSGLGKTRLVMEAIRGEPMQPLVVYVPAEDQFPPAFMSYLQTQGRRVVLVIDECEAARHEVYASILAADTTIKLITISEPSSRSTRSPMLKVDPIDREALHQLLSENQPALWAEAIRVIVDVAAGNIDYALKASKALLSRRTDSAGSLVDPADIRQFIAEELPQGALFLASCVLALFSRIGFEGDVGHELVDIAGLTGVPVSDLRAAAAELAANGLLAKQGRYRSVGPSPVAIYLAAQGWQQLGTAVAESLLPGLDDDMTERLFRRASEIGDAALPYSALDVMLADDGPLGSLDALEDAKSDRLLQHLAVLSPGRVSNRLHELISSASEDELRSRSTIRRPLIWALSKLAWHTETFEDAADDLLELALAENETYSNNSTGTWVDLFGTQLPATSARPEVRLEYLQKRSDSSDVRVRSVVIKAATRALELTETIVASAELQGGAILDARGAPSTWPELFAYRNGALDLLRGLVDDPDTAVSDAAMNALVEAIHPSLDDYALRAHLVPILTALSGARQREIRMKLRSLDGLFERTGGDKERVDALDEFEAALPMEGPEERLWVALHLNPWDLVDGTGESIREALRSIPEQQIRQTLLEALCAPLPAAFEVGAILASLPDDDGSVEASIAPLMGGENSGAVFGFLLERVSKGAVSAFDDFSKHYQDNDVALLALTTRGPRSPRAVERVDELVGRVPVVVGARQLFPWVVECEPIEVAGFLTSWMERTSSQQDYNAVVDLAALYVQRHGVADVLAGPLSSVVSRRFDFPQVGQQNWDWTQLASKLLESDPQALAELMITMVETDAISAFSSSPDGALLKQAVEAAGDGVWRDVMDRLLSRDSWRLAFTGRGWLAHVVSLDTVKTWVGESVERARVVASVTDVGGVEVSPVGRFLLEHFDKDDRVASSLSGEYVSGSWTGNESDRIARQVAELQGWLKVKDQPDGVKRWVRRMVEGLRRQLTHTREREAEGDC